MTGNAKRRNKRAARRQAEFDGVDSREGLCSDLLIDPRKIPQDLALVKKAARWGGLTGTKKRKIVDRLFKIVEKEFTTRLNSNGEVIHDEEMADQNAMTASKILVSIEQQQQRDEHTTAKLNNNASQPPQTTINVGVNVDNRTDERRDRALAIAERIRAGRILDSDSGK